MIPSPPKSVLLLLVNAVNTLMLTVLEKEQSLTVVTLGEKLKTEGSFGWCNHPKNILLGKDKATGTALSTHSEQV